MTDITPQQQDGMQQILNLMETHNLTPGDVKKSYAARKKAKKTGDSAAYSKGELILRLFAYLGGALIFVGLGTFIETVWDDIGSLARVVITFGSGFTAYLCALAFAHDARLEKAATPAFLVAFLLQPFGLFVLLDEYFPGDDAALGSIVVFGPLALQQALTYIKFRRPSLLLYALLYFIGLVGGVVEYFDIHRGFSCLAFGTFLLLVTIHMQMRIRLKDLTPAFFIISTLIFFSGVYYYVGRTVFDPIALSLTLALLGFAVTRESKTLYLLCLFYMMGYYVGGPGGGFSGFDLSTHNQLAAIFTGASLVFTGQWLRQRTDYISLHPLWMFLGTAFALGGAYMIFPGHLQPVAIGFAALAIYGALLLRSRAVLAAAIISLINFIVAYTAEYFADTIGWPILLIFLGIVVLASGFLFARLAGRIKNATPA